MKGVAFLSSYDFDCILICIRCCCSSGVVIQVHHIHSVNHTLFSFLLGYISSFSDFLGLH